MPYIKKEDRESVARIGPVTAGELNYAITILLLNYWNLHSKNYLTINDLIGALEGAKLEFYRRIVVPYENTKITQNGDVYGS